MPIKRFLRGTRLYRYFQDRRLRKSQQAWTPHDDEMVRFYGQFMGRGDVVFDVGANIGNRTRVFARLCRQVVAVEPQSRCVALLTAAFSNEPKVAIVHTALGAAEGTATMNVSVASTVSSMSPEWINAVKASGRFGSEVTWDQTEQVPVTALDKLIERFGVPAFVKIDVEGFEPQVVAGLSRPVNVLSYEFTPERLGDGLAVLDKLASLGPVEANYAQGEEMKLVLPAWVSTEQLKDVLKGFEGNTEMFGDVYVRFR
jgi:FkbM family methyltransferase